MSKILKFKVDDEVEFPVRSKILKVQERNGVMYAWALVDGDEAVTATRRFLIVGTGHEFNRRGWDYLTTIHDDLSTWHVFTQWADEEDCKHGIM